MSPSDLLSLDFFTIGKTLLPFLAALAAGLTVALLIPRIPWPRRGPGGQVTATVSWRVPNFFGGLLRLFGAGSDDVISGQAVAVFRKEGL